MAQPYDDYYSDYQGKLTERGQRVIESLDAACKTADEDRTSTDKINALPGMVRHYYVNVFKAAVITRENWVKDYVNGADAVWRNIQDAEERQRVAETAATSVAATTDLAKTLETVKTELMAEVAKLQAEIAELRAGKTAEGKPRK